jgi:hypothetical protein
MSSRIKGKFASTCIFSSVADLKNVIEDTDLSFQCSGDPETASIINVDPDH